MQAKRVTLLSMAENIIMSWSSPRKHEEAPPRIRFRTADLAHVIIRESCGCGRTHLKIAPITGWRDDMLIVKGVSFSPKQIEQTLLGIPGIGNDYHKGAFSFFLATRLIFLIY